MTAVQKTAAIRDLLASGLPSLLTTTGLDDFADYLNKSPTKADEKQISVYIDSEINNVDSSSFAVVIQAQIYGKDQVQEYHSVIMPFLESDLNGIIVDMVQRMEIQAELFPIDRTSTSHILYYVLFKTDLDDCEE